MAPLLREQGRPQDPGAEAIFQRYLGRADSVVLVAEEPDHLVVAEDRRGRGVGAALLRRAEDLARERRCWGMSLESANWRRGSHAFYIRQGWRDTGASFTKSLSDRPWPPAPPDGLTADRPPPG